MLPVSYLPGFDARHRLDQLVVFGCPDSHATKGVLDPLDKSDKGGTRQPARYQDTPNLSDNHLDERNARGDRLIDQFNTGSQPHCADRR